MRKQHTKLYAGICLILCITVIAGVAGLIYGTSTIFKQTDEGAPPDIEDAAGYTIGYTDDDLIRALPENGQKYELPEDVLNREVAITLYQATLHCSDGVNRTAMSLVESPTYLSGDEDKQTTDGILSATDNISLMSVIYASQGATLSEMLDAVVQMQISGSGDGVPVLVSDTINASDNLFLTGCITANGNVSTEAMLLLHVLDENTVQVYILSRNYEDAERDYDLSTTEGLLKSFASSEESKDVFYNCLSSLVKAISKAGGGTDG